ncbi:hypothetical protein MASR2M78_32650 [Treponema sp.]
MYELRDEAQSALDTNHPVEALRHLVGLLALDTDTKAETDTDRANERAELVRSADAKINAIGAALSLEPNDEWLEQGQQVAESMRRLAKGTARMPSARLVANYDFGKSVVADAPIRFSFIDGGGELINQANTDANGSVRTSVRTVAKADAPAVIRAMLVVTNRGKTRTFPEVFLDFSYLLPSRSARVFALERSQFMSSQEVASLQAARSPLLDATLRGLEGSELDLLATDSTTDDKTFNLLMNGDLVSIQKLAFEGPKPVSYLVLSLTEYSKPRQMVLQGKTYDIFTVDAQAQVRVLRQDGSPAFSRPLLRVRGQGGTAESAIQAALELARTAVEKDLRSEVVAIRSALD